MPVASRPYRAASPSSERAKRRFQVGAQARSTLPPPADQPHNTETAASAAKAVPTGAANENLQAPATAAAGAARMASANGNSTARFINVYPPPLPALRAFFTRRNKEPVTSPCPAEERFKG